MDPITNLYGTRLERELSIGAGMDKTQVTTLLGKYLTLVARSNPEAAFRYIHSTYGNSDTDCAVAGIKSELEKLSEGHPGIDSNPISRIRAYIKRMNSQIAKCEVEVTGIREELLAEHQKTQLEIARQQRQAVKLATPEFAKEKNFEAVAKTQGKRVKLQMSIRI